MSQSLIDALEARKLFAVTLDNGVLNIIGTAHGDTVDVYAEPKNPAKLDVKLNGQVTQFDRADVKSLFIRGFRGRDIIHVGDSRPQYRLDDALPSRIYADAGDDVVFVYSGATRVFGGDGNDMIVNSHLDRSRCTLYGENGNDQLQGGVGADLIAGGEGDDALWGSYGRDTLDGGAGNDQLQRSWDTDRLYGGSGNDSLYGTDSSDTLLDHDAGDVMP